VEVNTLTRIEVNLKNFSHIEFHRYAVRKPLGGSAISELAHDGLRLVFNQQLVSEVKKHFYIEDRESRSGPEYFNVPGVDLPARDGYQASNNSYLVPVLYQLQQVCSDPEI